MHENIHAAMKQYLTEQLADCKAREALLMQEQRSDEATLARIEGNIYDVFATVWNVAAREQDHEKGLTFFRTRLSQIPQAWRDSRDKALAHGDAEKAHIEAVKLAAAQAVSDALDRITEAEA